MYTAAMVQLPYLTQVISLVWMANACKDSASAFISNSTLLPDLTACQHLAEVHLMDTSNVA